jgi:nitroreductase
VTTTPTPADGPDRPGDPRAPRPGAEGLAEPLRSRWSPSVFDANHRIDDADLELLLHAARWAPSSGNLQPWTFVVCRRGDAGHRRLVPTLSRGNSGWVPRASAVLVGLARTEDHEGRPLPYALYDTGQAAAHLTLQARAIGLHAHQFAGFDHDALARSMRVPPTVRVVAGIAVGVPGDPAEVDDRTAGRDQRDRVRKPLGDVASVGEWGVPWPG